MTMMLRRYSRNFTTFIGRNNGNAACGTNQIYHHARFVSGNSGTVGDTNAATTAAAPPSANDALEDTAASRRYRLWSSIKGWSYDSFDLMGKVVTKQHLNTSWMDILVSQARQSNRMAISLLHIEKELGLIRYWGLMSYLKTKFPNALNRISIVSRLFQNRSNSSNTGGSTSGNGGDDDDEEGNGDSKKESTSNGNDNTAKIAFMVTSNMRTELSERLGYDAEDIRRMTPLEASLILQHDVSPSDQETMVPTLVEEHNRITAEQQQEKLLKQQEQDAAEAAEAASAAEAEAAAVAAEAEAAANANTSQAMPSQSASTSSETTTMLTSLEADTAMTEETTSKATTSPSFFASQNELLLPSRSTTEDSTWYEVIETYTQDGSESVVGLYGTREEAEDGLEIRAFLANRKSLDKNDSRSAHLKYRVEATTK